jgi:hypothetical protein
VTSAAEILGQLPRTSPWSRLGFGGGPVGIREAMTLGGLDWEVRLEPLYLSGGRRLRGRSALVRADRRAPLSVVGSQYRPVQNLEALGILDGLWDGPALVESAGALGDGRRYWALARTNLPEGEWSGVHLRPMVMLTGSHDGTGRIRLRLAAVCTRTLSLVPVEADATLPVLHLGHGHPRLTTQQVALSSFLREQWHRTRTLYHRLAAAPCGPVSRFSMATELVPRAETRSVGAAKRDGIMQLAERESSTRLGFLSAVAAFVDQERTRFTSPRSQRAADVSALFGPGAALKSRAMQIVLTG